MTTIQVKASEHEEFTFMGRWQYDQLSLYTTCNKELHANIAGEKHRALKGLDPRIDPNKPPRTFRYAVKVLDKQALAEAFNLEQLGFIEQVFNKQSYKT